MNDSERFSVLIVDDEKANIKVLNHILQPMYDIYTSKDGRTAIEMAGEYLPDIILLDVMMPDMTGYEVLAILKDADRTKDIPVIFITGLNSVEDEIQGFELGAADYITKPFNNTIVKVRVEQQLRIVRQIRTIEHLNERINSELKAAAKIQSDMLPDLHSKFANHQLVDLFALVNPALEMGGDLYDVFFIDKEKNNLCVVIADVSGKGIPSAMFMVMAKTLIRSYIFSGENPADALKKANNHLCEDNPSSMFVTASVSLCDLNTGQCQYSQAGHNPTAYCRPDSEFVFAETKKTMPLGFLPDNEYPLLCVKLIPGTKFFYYTDGVTEALDEKDEQWGEERLLTSLNGCHKCSCAEIAKHVLDDIASHVGQAQQSDDITILVAEYHGQKRE